MVNYLIPGKNDCKTCHSYNGNLLPLGMAGILHGKPESGSIPGVLVWDDSSTVTLELRARIYLDVNCSHCHRREGSAGSTGDRENGGT